VGSSLGNFFSINHSSLIRPSKKYGTQRFIASPADRISRNFFAKKKKKKLSLSMQARYTFFFLQRKLIVRPN
jgi:hypothetical protein